MKNITLTNILVLVLLLSNIIVISQERNYSFKLIPAPLLEKANSVVRFENSIIDIKSQDEMMYSYETAITILNKQADYLADITVPYDKRAAIKSLKAYIYNANGIEVKKVKSNEFKDYSAQDGISLFNDGRMMHYDHIPTSYPYTIYYSFEIRTSNTAFIPGWILNNSYNQSIETSHSEIKYPEGITLKKSEKNFDGFDVKKTENTGYVSYDVAQVKALERETYAPYLSEILPYVKFGINKFNLEGVRGEAENWQEFGKWYYTNLIDDTLELPASSKNSIIELTKGITDPIEKAKIVYDFVQSKVRYISVQVGIGGFKPMQAADVDKLSYGDCKALTNYTSALLKAVGVESYHTLIYGSDKKNLDSDIASPQGNHMILYIPNQKEGIWLECTSQKMPFGEIGSFTDDRDALIITPNGGEIKHTKVYEADESLQLTTGTFEISNDGIISAALKIASQGTQYDDNLHRNDGKSPNELDVLFKNYLSNINNIKFSKVEIKNDRAKATFMEELAFTATNYGTKAGNQLLVPVNAFNNTTSIPKSITNRKLPFEFERGYSDVDEVVISIPPTSTIEFIPKKEVLTTKFGSYSFEIEKINATNLKFKRKLSIHKGMYPKEDYELFRQFKKDIKNYDNSKMVLKIN